MWRAAVSAISKSGASSVAIGLLSSVDPDCMGRGLHVYRLVPAAEGEPLADRLTGAAPDRFSCDRERLLGVVGDVGGEASDRRTNSPHRPPAERAADEGQSPCG